MENKNKVAEKIDENTKQCVGEDPSHVCNIKDKNTTVDMSDEQSNILSKRPWHNSAQEILFKMPNGMTKKCWVMSVIDANGDTVCFGKTSDMKFIREMENSFSEPSDISDPTESDEQDRIKESQQI